MLAKLLKHKKITHLLPLVGIVIFFAFFAPHTAHAAQIPSNTCDILNVGCMIQWAVFGVWWIVAYLIQTILVFVLYITGFILDNVFLYNILLNPNIMPAVKDGWRVLRDISNGFFLIILLWLSIKIIWNVGGDSKRTIINLIIVAFLINFSLAITGAAFGFGNALAKPFRDKMANDVAGFIVSRTRISTVEQTPTTEGTAAVAAAFASNAKDCGLGALVDANVKIGCAGGEVAIDIGAALKDVTNNVHFAILNSTMQMLVSSIFLLLVIITFGCVIGLLIARIIMMVFLGVVSPLAFLFAAIPGQPQGLFKQWKKEVINWTFIAPIFYFLFYVSLLMLDAMTGTELFKAGAGMNFASNILAFLPLVVFLAFLWLSLYVCKNMTGKIGAMAEGLGKAAVGAALTIGAGVATSGASLALGAAGRGAGQLASKVTGKDVSIQGSMDWLANKPIMGKVAAPLTNRLRNYYTNQSQEIDSMRSEYTKMPPRLLQQQLKSTLSANKKVAMAEALHSMGEFKTLDVATQDKVIGYSRRYGRQENLLKERLDLATKNDVPNATDDADAQKKILNKMSPKEKSAISLTALENDMTSKLVLESLTKADVQTMLKTNADMINKLIIGIFYDANKMVGVAMKEETKAFINSTMAIQVLRPQQQQQNQSAPPPTPAPNNPAAANNPPNPNNPPNQPPPAPNNPTP